MHVPVPLLILIAATILVLAAMALRRRGESRDLVTPPRFGARPPPPQRPPRAWPAGAAPIGDLPADVAAEVRALLAADRKIEAVKLARAATGLGLADAKEMVERMGS